MLSSIWARQVTRFLSFNKNVNLIQVALKSSSSYSNLSPDMRSEVDTISKFIYDHLFPDSGFRVALAQNVNHGSLSVGVVENVLGRLFAAHVNGLKAYEFFKFSLQVKNLNPSSDSFEKTLHILTRMRYFDQAWDLMVEMVVWIRVCSRLKSMSIMLSRIAKFGWYEEALGAFERMEKVVFVGRKMGSMSSIVLLRAFCTQRQMKEARSIFHKMYQRFTPNIKTMNILLLGFKESGNVEAVELFYHEMVKRGFKPNTVTYNIRIDIYCKKRCFGDGLKLLRQMENATCSPTLETITTLIHGAGLIQNIARAWELFNELP